MRSVIVFSAALALFWVPVPASAEPESMIAVVWSGGAVSPGVCVEKGNWFVSVIPEEVSLEGLETVRLRSETGEQGARILHLDAEDRLCLIESGEGMTTARPVPFGKCLTPKPGDKAKCVSGIGGCRATVAGKDWSYRGERFPLPLLRLRVSESGPHCQVGTALVCEEGSLLGLLTNHSIEASGEVYAIPATRIRKLVEDVKRHRRSGPVWIGLLLHLDSSTPEVVQVKADSPAARAGVKEGDVILSIGGNAVETFEDVLESIHNLAAGETVVLSVLRGLEEQRLTILPQFAEVAVAT